MPANAPATLAQQGIWLNEERGAAGSVYHMPFTVTFDEPALDRGTLVAACQAVVARHPILASAFTEVDGAPRVGPAARPPQVAVVSLAGDAALDEAIQAEIRRPCDIAQGPLVRMSIFDLGDGRQVLLVVPHHLVFDGESMEIFKHDLAAAYTALRAGRQPPGPLDGYTLADDAVVERQALAELIPPARRHWRSRWREPAGMVLPGLRGEAADIEPGSYVHTRVDEPVWQRVRSAGKQIGVTRFEFLIASLFAVLHGYGNTRPALTLAIGTRSADRAGAVGCFGTELPVATAFPPTATFAELALALRTDLRELYRFRSVPLNRAVTGIRPSAMRTPVSLTYRRHATVLDFAGTPGRAEWRFNHHARGALWIQTLDEGDGLRAFFRYPTRLFDRDSVERIAGHWQRLLTAAAEAPRTRVMALPMLSTEERNRPRVTRRDHRDRPGATVLDLVAEQVEERPEKIAAICGRQRTTFGRLAAAAAGLAERLRCAGVSAGSPVAVLVPPSIDALTAHLAVLTAGGAVLPLDPGPPPDGPDASVAAVAITAGPSDQDGWRPPPGVPVVPVEERGCACGRGHPLPAALSGRQAAYLTPSGVAIEHDALRARLLAVRDLTGTTDADTWLCHGTGGADRTLPEFLLPLLVGARMVLIGDPTHPAAAGGTGLAELIRRHRVTHAWTGAASWLALCQAGFEDPRVTAIVAGGGGLPPTVDLDKRVRQVHRVRGDAATGPWWAGERASGEAERREAGGPLPGYAASVRTPWGAPAPPGVAGEVYVGGAALARGYRDQPSRTAERFVADGAGAPGSRAVRTGRRGWLTPDGTIELAVEESDLRPEADAAHSAAGGAPEPGVTEAAGGDVNTALEQDIARIWRDVLKVSTVGREDNLFEFGVNSLAVTRIAARIHQRLKVDVPLDVFYERPTVASLAMLVAKRQQGS